MRLALTDEQEALRDAVRALLARRAGSAAVRAAAESERGHDPELWATLCAQIGVAGLGVPDGFGGAGAGIVECAVVAEELGAVLAPAPFLGSAVLVARALVAGGDADACARLLPGIANGTSVAALAVSGPGGGWAPAVTESGGTLTGRAHYVLDGDLADVLLVATPTGIFEVPADDARRTRMSTLDITRRLAVVELAGATGRRIGGPEALERARDEAAAVLAAESVGAAERALDLTVAYTKQRVQFGRPIGSFQALKHRMADAYVLVRTARSAARAAAWAADHDPEALPVRSAVAAVYCADAFRRVTAEAIQLHGGIAITWEHDAHLYFKRAHGSAHLFGRPAEHLRRVATLAGITP